MKEAGGQLTSNSLIKKVNLMFLIIILFFLAITFANYRLFSQVKNSYNRSTEINNKIINLKETAIQCQDAIAEFVRNGNRINLSDHNEGISFFEKALKVLQDTPQTSAKLSLLKSIEYSFYSYQTACNYAAFHFSGERPLLSQAYLEEAERINNYLQSYCEIFCRLASQRIKNILIIST